MLSCVQLFATPWIITRPWNSPGRNNGVGCHFLLQGIFPTQGLNPGLPHSLPSEPTGNLEDRLPWWGIKAWLGWWEHQILATRPSGSVWFVISYWEYLFFTSCNLQFSRCNLYTMKNVTKQFFLYQIIISKCTSQIVRKKWSKWGE